MSSSIYKTFNRHIGRVLTYLDMAKVDENTKRIVKGELWQLHDDVLSLDKNRMNSGGEENDDGNHNK